MNSMLNGKRVAGNRALKTSNYISLFLNYLNARSAFTLVEIMVAMLIMVAAIVPVTALMTNNAKETNISEAYGAMMHQSTRILDTLLERVQYSDIIAAAKLYGLTDEMETKPVEIINLLDIKDSTNADVPVFDKELLHNGPGIAAGKTWQYAEPSRQFQPIVYKLKIQQIDKVFRYLLNVGIDTPITTVGQIPSFDTVDPAGTPPADKKISSVFLGGKLMKITLFINWGTPRTGVTRTYQHSYSLVTFKANLEK